MSNGSLPREQLAKHLSDRLVVLEQKLKARTGASLNDGSHVIETVLGRFFNALFGWKLTNLNPSHPNAPGIDLLDEDRRLGIQVTNNSDGDKHTDTAQRAIDHHLNQRCDRIILFFLLSTVPTVPKKFQQPPQGPMIEPWCIRDLLKQMVGTEVSVAQLLAAKAVLDEEAPDDARPSGLHQLPPDPRLHGFVGRGDDLDKMLTQASLAVTAITGLKGMGGIGKTALSVVLGHELAPRFPDGQLFIECRGTSPTPPTAQELLIRIIDLLKPGSARELPDDLAALGAAYRDLLHGRRILLVLDNASGTEQVKPLLPPSGCGLIVSSRHPLVLGSAGLVHIVGKLKEAEAIALLREFHEGLLDADAKELARLCAGLPLALKLAGSHLQLDGPEPDVAGYIERLQQSRIGALDPEAADAGEVTISETLRLSEAMLKPEERDAWRALGVFTHCFEEGAAAAVMRAFELAAKSPAVGEPTGARTLLSATSVSSPSQADDSREDEVRGRSMADKSVRAPLDAAALLSLFVRRSLLERLPGGRYEMHDLAAEYARERLGEETCTALRLAHARHYQSIAQKADALYLAGDSDVSRRFPDYETYRRRTFRTGSRKAGRVGCGVTSVSL
ncbi:MAG: SMEK domain-containing protein [Verrucomicrobiaceae bacterium]|nr:SMEK domain-containing protein [Verrucomicrobiaceae bacterium]